MADEQSARGTRVLIVEDSPEDTHFLTRMLETKADAPIRVVGATCLDDALLRLERSPIDVVLLDLGLPDTDGFDALSEIRVACPSMPVIVITGVADQSKGQRALALGAQDYLTKGEITPEGLRRAVQYAQERARVSSQLLKTQRLEGLGLIAAGIAHDFNNLLTPILGHATLLEGEQSDAERHDSISQIKAAVRRAAVVVRQLGQYSGGEEPKPRRIQPAEWVSRSTELLRLAVPALTQLTFECSPETPDTVLDPSQFQQLLMALVSNAAEAIGEEVAGTIAVCTGADDRDLVVTVSDTGPGMSGETRRQAFEPFFSTKAEGRGLGLAVVWKIVEQGGGEVSLLDSDDGGTVVRIRLPGVLRATSEAPAKPKGRRVWRGEGKVLVVDDQEPIRRVLTAILQGLGFETLAASNGQEALSLFDQEREEIVITILDRSMPKMCGVETFKAMRRLDPDCRVILCSGSLETEEFLESLGGEIPSGYLGKPFDVASFRVALDLAGVLKMAHSV